MMEDAEDLAGQRIFERPAQALDLLGQIFPIDKLVRVAALDGAERRGLLPGPGGVSLS